MFVAVNRITAPAPAIDRMVEGFRRNAASLKDFAGFIALELWRGDGTLDAVSKWDSRESFEAWASSDSFLASHGFARGQGGSGGSAVAYYEAEVVSGE